MLNLPDDILLNIFSRLQVKYLIRCRCVCKPWCTTLRNPDYVKILLNHAIKKNDSVLMLRENSRLYSIDYNDSSPQKLCDEAVELDCPLKSVGYVVRILGTCNGLVCITGGVEDICIWNPVTKEYKKIPTPPNEFQGLSFPSKKKNKIPRHLCINPAAGAYGFGYDCKLDDYKLVRIVGFVGARYGSGVQVYTLGSNSWKTFRSIPYRFCYGRPPGVLVDGALHWIASRIGIKRSEAIISFDIVEERFEEVPEPECFDFSKHHSKNVGLFGGCLFLHDVIHTVGAEVWVMKNYGVRESWTKLFTFEIEMKFYRSIAFKDLRPIESLNEGYFLFEIDNSALVYYNPHTDTEIILEIRGIPKWFITETYVLRSLVSVNSGTYVGQEQIDKSLEYKNKLRKRKWKE